jgi:hypothetical protein
MAVVGREERGVLWGWEMIFLVVGSCQCPWDIGRKLGDGRKLSFICPGHVHDMSSDRTNDRNPCGHANLSGHAAKFKCVLKCPQMSMKCPQIPLHSGFMVCVYVKPT